MRIRPSQRAKDLGGCILIQDKNNSDRRAADRFPIEREVRYKVLNKKNTDEMGIGQTVKP